MLLKLEKLIAKYGMKITGVIQAGAHEGEEIDEFIRLGIKEGHLFEPCISYIKLLDKGIGEADFTMHHCALGNYKGEATMHLTSFNKGQSNSLLVPKKHLEYFPQIEFDNDEPVYIRLLDSFEIDYCNFLVMDVQGYELEVLKGATETLKHIDYIYTEVNREELYENCAMVEDLDNYLTEFRRVETKWKRKGFGDALYIRSTLL